MMKEQVPLLGMIYVQVSYGAMFLITRVALTRGLSSYLFVFYRQAVATLVITPVAVFLESDRSKLTLKNVGKISLLAFMGITVSQNFYYAGLALTSTTLTTAMNNINPALTFLMAAVLGLEKLQLWTRMGQAKIWGTLLCVGGAMIMTLFKGPAITPLNSPSALPVPQEEILPPGGSSWVFGAFLVAAGVWAWAAFVIYQAWIAGDSPSQLTSTAVTCWMGTIQTALVALLFEEPAAWRLKWDLELLTISYSGIFCSALGLFVQMWCVKERGPLFITVFNPLATVMVAVLEPLLLNVPLHWESLTGTVMVIGGLYSVLWGKAKEMQEEEEIARTSECREPLLVIQSDGEQMESETCIGGGV